MKSYKDLEVYKISMELFFRVHPFSLQLPKYELYELGSQLRRSSDSIHTNIVEGYGRRRYKADFIKFLVYTHASTLETINHLEKIGKIYSTLLADANNYTAGYEKLGGKIFNFIQYVENNWKS
ncbi:MAG: four helix bundle protein [Saprospiraceae bacterium]|nr:four helix bundle protein [Saprospiraceae bacterium]